MDEDKLLEGFAKALGSVGEKALKDIEEKKNREKKLLDGLASALGPEAQRKLDEIKKAEAEKEKSLAEKREEIRLRREKEEEANRLRREKEQKLLDELNKSLAALVSGNPQHAEAIEKEVQQTIEELPTVAEVVAQEESIETAKEEVVAETEETVAENAAQPQPELADTIITRAVKDISKSTSKKQQKEEDKLPSGLRRELDNIKKSIADLHRFSINSSQLVAGGGEVKLARLDDVDFGTAEDGYYLKFDGATGKFVFDLPTGAGSAGVSVSNVVVNADGYLIITYSNTATSNAGYVVGSAGANGANGTNGLDGANGISITNAAVDANGYLIITYSNTYVANAGYVVGGGGGGFTNGQSISVATIEVSTALVPATNNDIDIGTNELRFHTLYLSGNTIVLGNATIEAINSGVNLPANSKVDGQPIATGASLIYDGGGPTTDFSVGLSLDCGGVT